MGNTAHASLSLPSINKFPLKGAESRHSQSVALSVELVRAVDPATRVRRQGRIVEGVLFEAAVGEIGQRQLYCKERRSTFHLFQIFWMCAYSYPVVTKVRAFDVHTNKIRRSPHDQTILSWRAALLRVGPERN